MAEVSIDLNMVRVTNEDFVKKAEACTPELLKTVVRPVSIVDIVKTEEVYPEVHKKDEIKNLSGYHLAKGDKICLDFGDHQVGLGCFWGRSMVFGEFLSGLGVILFFLGLFLTCFGVSVWF